MKLCNTCRGMGSVPVAKMPGNTKRCEKCNGTGRVDDPKLAAEPTPVDATQKKEK